MLTMQEYMDEVLLRLSRYEITMEVDWGTTEAIINKARRDVQMATLSLFRERYTRVITLDVIPGNTFTLDPNYTVTSRRWGVTSTINWYWAQLPQDFIRDIVVHYGQASEGNGGGTNSWAARKVILKEMFNASANGIVKPIPSEPLYAVERLTSEPFYRLYFSLGEDEPAVENTEIWYIRAIDYLQRLTTAGGVDIDWETPPQAVELVIYQAMMLILRRLNFIAEQTQQSIVQDMEDVIAMFEETFKTEIDRSYLMLPSRESLTPNVPILDSEVQQQAQRQ